MMSIHTPHTSTVSPRRSSGRGRRRVRAASGIASAVAVSALVAAPLADATPAAATTAPMTCKEAVGNTGPPHMVCTITKSGTVRLPDDIPALMADLPADTPVTISAVGGKGGQRIHESDPGRGGRARTVIDYATLAASDLHVYVGQSAPKTAVGSFLGGTASLVTSEPLGPDFDIDDVYVLAGGGGAQGKQYGNLLCDYGGGHGGRGGHADASKSIAPVSQAGVNGAVGWRMPLCEHNGAGGTGGHDGVGGTQSIDRRYDGADGVGGRGGDTNWIGNLTEQERTWAPGAGGTTSVYAQGGGGYGGGAGGTRGSGAGGGGSYAAAARVVELGQPTWPGESTVTIAWPQSTAEVAASDGGMVDYYLDGKVAQRISDRDTLTIPAGHIVITPNEVQVPAKGPALVPRPNSGQVFTGWSGDATGVDHQVVPITGHREEFTAHFGPPS